MNLVLQTLEICENVVVCVNLMDEARRKKIRIDLQGISQKLGVPVVGTIARKKKSLEGLLRALDSLSEGERPRRMRVKYPPEIEEAISYIQPVLHERLQGRLDSRWLSLQLLDQDPSLIREVGTYLGEEFLQDEQLVQCIRQARELLQEKGIGAEKFKDQVVRTLVRAGEAICRAHVSRERGGYSTFDRRMDRILTGRRAGYPAMILLLALIFWITITGANIPSQFLADGLFWLQDRLSELFMAAGAPNWLHGALVLGVYRVLAWVVSVMLPPMAIFFPLFTLLEDAGYLPRIAYNLDRPFKCCKACGKQALTMCMGFGCNAAGVVGCRIIDSPRERLLAVLTNSFVPCNGRFPTLIALLSMFFIGTSEGAFSGMLSALLLTGLILLGIGMTFLVTRLLSATLLKGIPSSFTLELPPYRRPQIGRVLVRSLLDRTLFVLGRAASIAAPAGLLLWLLANLTVDGSSLLSHCAAFLDPFGRLLGMDGVILIAFILGWPANEIVVPIMIMAYLAQGSLTEMSNLLELKQLFVSHGWTWVTALCTMLFSLMHWPCSTTLITIKKETGSWKWTAIAFLIPTAAGMLACLAVATAARIF
jgi:ferrous iron transport protein B